MSGEPEDAFVSQPSAEEWRVRPWRSWVPLKLPGERRGKVLLSLNSALFVGASVGAGRRGVAFAREAFPFSSMGAFRRLQVCRSFHCGFFCGGREKPSPSEGGSGEAGDSASAGTSVGSLVASWRVTGVDVAVDGSLALLAACTTKKPLLSKILILDIRTGRQVPCARFGLAPSHGR